jgi:histidinol-phosphatase
VHPKSTFMGRVTHLNDNLKTYLDFVVQTAREAGKITQRYFGTGIQTEYKSDQSPVTIADRAAEEYIRSQINKFFPEHSILGEEFGESQASAVYRWLIDPIDGTRSFVRGVPLYGVLIGLEIEGQVQVGAAYFPALDEMLSAATGLGCWWNNQKAEVSQETNLSRALVAHADTASFARQGKEAAWQRLTAATGYRAGWADAYAYLLVATGRAEIGIDPIMNPWDCAPFPVILEEAGGYFGDWQGNPGVYGNESVATSRALLSQVLKTLHPGD